MNKYGTALAYALVFASGTAIASEVRADNYTSGANVMEIMRDSNHYRADAFAADVDVYVAPRARTYSRAYAFDRRYHSRYSYPRYSYRSYGYPSYYYPSSYYPSSYYPSSYYPSAFYGNPYSYYGYGYSRPAFGLSVSFGDRFHDRFWDPWYW